MKQKFFKSKHELGYRASPISQSMLGLEKAHDRTTAGQRHILNSVIGMHSQMLNTWGVFVVGKVEIFSKPNKQEVFFARGGGFSR